MENVDGFSGFNFHDYVRQSAAEDVWRRTDRPVVGF